MMAVINQWGFGVFFCSVVAIGCSTGIVIQFLEVVRCQGWPTLSIRRVDDRKAKDLE